jgi:hypothetical protein
VVEWVREATAHRGFLAFSREGLQKTLGQPNTAAPRTMDSSPDGRNTESFVPSATTVCPAMRRFGWWGQPKGPPFNPETRSPALMLGSWVQGFGIRSRWVWGVWGSKPLGLGACRCQGYRSGFHKKIMQNRANNTEPNRYKHVMLGSWVRGFGVRNRWVLRLAGARGIEVGFIKDFNAKSTEQYRAKPIQTCDN